MTEDKILIVEDEKRIREMIKEYLENEGYIIAEASNGEEGLEKFFNDEYSIVILDVMLPKLDGWSVCREIRSKSHTPIIMLTARGEEYDRLFGFELGADDYIVKPFSPRELSARIKAIIRRSRCNEGTGANDDFQHKNFKVNFNARSVIINGINADLTPREFDLLSFFIKNPNKVFSREQLLDKVWGFEFGGDSRTVDTHIKMLRDSLGEYRSLIVTAWGVGYKFEIGG